MNANLAQRLAAAGIAARDELRAVCPHGENLDAFARVTVDGVTITVRAFDHDAVVRQAVGLALQSTCECADPICPAHRHVSHCGARATSTLWRTDTSDDLYGTQFCAACAAGAIDTGFYTDDPIPANDDEADPRCRYCGKPDDSGSGVCDACARRLDAEGRAE